MEFETVERCGRVYVVKNGVESEGFVLPNFDGYAIFQPEQWLECKTLNGALELIAGHMDTWYAVGKAAERLVELGAFEKAPTTHDICMWARLGLLPGAVKIQGKGGAGQGGAWRIPEEGLVEFAKRREQR